MPHFGILSSMLRRLCYISIVAAIISCASTATFAQRVDAYIDGIVHDSLTRLPLAYVTVYNQTKSVSATTDENGGFKIKAGPGDSILFSILGYTRKKRMVGIKEQAMMIFLREFAVTLKPVTIYGSFMPHGADRWKTAIEMPSIFRNPAGPGSGYVVETFGPGISIGGLLSKLSKSEKEKKKLSTIRAKAKRSETYLSVIVSEETKSFFEKTFSMSEPDYEKFIESFNTAHPEAVYIESKEDVINLMVAFIATKR